MRIGAVGACVASLLRGGAVVAVLAGAALAQEELPFPPAPSGSRAGLTLQDSDYGPRAKPRRLPADAPNILVVLIDDTGPAFSSTFGGGIRTPTMDRIARDGITFNRFHTTAMCSPTRAALLTGRNHHRVGNGQVAELANDWDGYTGVIPRSSATVAEVLKDYGYATGAWGKWHNTPALETTAAGPFDRWPTGYGFEYFYGFLAGEASQYEPHLVRNTTVVAPPKTAEEGYHLSEDLADDAIAWVRRHRSLRPDQPFFMYWASGATHGPHHVPKEWADRYKGKFDDGWDAYRERAFRGAKEKGWIPADAKLTPRPDTMPSWESVPEAERPFQRRLMEVFAGFSEHVDAQVGRIVDAIDELGCGENTLVLYIWGDNGPSAEGIGGTISGAQVMNGIRTTTAQQLAALEPLGGLDALGTPKTDSHFNAAWAWAGATPYRSTKLVAAHFGGTRNPMAIRWPRKIRPDATPRPQFHHANDIVPTIYEILGITPPRRVNGAAQDPLDGTSFAYALGDPKAPGRKRTQYFEVMASCGIYHDGWFAGTFGPRTPWLAGAPEGIAEWTPAKDRWELYDLSKDWTQAEDLAGKEPEKLQEMRRIFVVEAARNLALPIGGGLWVPVFHPELRPAPPGDAWEYAGETTRIPETCAPSLGNRGNLVTIEADVPENADGVLYALGGFSGGLSCYMKGGILSYEYNLFELQRTHVRSGGKIPAGKAIIEVETLPAERKPCGPLDVTLRVNGEVVGRGRVPASALLLFTGNDCLDFGADLGSPVSVDYYEKGHFPFAGRVRTVRVRYLK